MTRLQFFDVAGDVRRSVHTHEIGGHQKQDEHDRSDEEAGRSHQPEDQRYDQDEAAATGWWDSVSATLAVMVCKDKVSRRLSGF